MARPTKQQEELFALRNEMIRKLKQDGMSQVQIAFIMRLPEPTVSEVVRVLDDWQYRMVKCPVCSSENVHVGTAKFVDGKDDGKAWAGRGNAVKVTMNCEVGASRALRCSAA